MSERGVWIRAIAEKATSKMLEKPFGFGAPFIMWALISVILDDLLGQSMPPELRGPLSEVSLAINTECRLPRRSKGKPLHGRKGMTEAMRTYRIELPFLSWMVLYTALDKTRMMGDADPGGKIKTQFAEALKAAIELEFAANA